MRLASDHVKVRVPATSANLGPGFDALGLALDLWDEVEARALTGPTRVRVEGEGEGEVPIDDTHLVVRAAHAALEAVGAPEIGLDLRCVNRIPHGRGLGSSAAAAVAGGLIARGMIANPDALNNRAVFELATQFEGHPDNAAPAVFGKGTVAWMDDGVPRAARLDVSVEIEPVVLLPERPVSTRVARAVLPERVAHADAAFNVGRAALMVHALTAGPNLLFEASEDRLHQAARSSVMEESVDVLRELRGDGHAAVVSGAGPAILVLATAPLGDVIVPRAGWRLMPLRVATHGGTVARIGPAGTGR
ncbi:MAG: homoserine kinase [Bifidobacteriaceae bacterium]|jgi:homoserine kinase|nr:homoserine kinase [Bifidobacteriaceae bacterium]